MIPACVRAMGGGTEIHSRKPHVQPFTQNCCDSALQLLQSRHEFTMQPTPARSPTYRTTTTQSAQRLERSCPASAVSNARTGTML